MKEDYFILQGNPRTLLEIERLIRSLSKELKTNIIPESNTLHIPLSEVTIGEFCDSVSLKDVPDSIRAFSITEIATSLDKDSDKLSLTIRSDMDRNEIKRNFIDPLYKNFDLGQPDRTSQRKESLPVFEFEGTLLRCEDMHAFEHLLNFKDTAISDWITKCYSPEELDKKALLFLKNHINNYEYDLHSDALNYGLMNHTLCNDIKGALSRFSKFYMEFYENVLTHMDIAQLYSQDNNVFIVYNSDPEDPKFIACDCCSPELIKAAVKSYLEDPGSYLYLPDENDPKLNPQEATNIGYFDLNNSETDIENRIDIIVKEYFEEPSLSDFER